MTITHAQQMDWADKLAVEIIADIRSRPFVEARERVAGQLRVVKRLGHIEGIDDANEVMKRTFYPSQATLDREHERDVQDEEEGVAS